MLEKKAVASVEEFHDCVGAATDVISVTLPENAAEQWKFLEDLREKSGYVLLDVAFDRLPGAGLERRETRSYGKAWGLNGDELTA